MVLDISLPGKSGIDVLRQIRRLRPEARVLMLSMHEEIIFATRALREGALRYVTKASAPDVLSEAVLTVARGERYLSPELARRLALRELAGEAPPLTGRDSTY